MPLSLLGTIRSFSRIRKHVRPMDKGYVCSVSSCSCSRFMQEARPVVSRRVWGSPHVFTQAYNATFCEAFVKSRHPCSGKSLTFPSITMQCRSQRRSFVFQLQCVAAASSTPDPLSKIQYAEYCHSEFVFLLLRNESTARLGHDLPRTPCSC